MGQDTYWLDAVAQAAGPDVVVEPIDCAEGYPDCLSKLPPAEPEALLLVEAALRADIVALVQELRALGWPHIVVVAANPHIREARAVLKDGAAFDYWIKSYERPVIRGHLEQNLGELAGWMGYEQTDDPDRG
jgi:hypothetical protein